ncbi:MAG: DUF2283 domain-containing protein [Candidatus Verstraetearchaeota archaeon]|nr:DUF2283 domain-containing protein [Candidatus Verstraetearchaeota archaeon]
MAYKIKYDEKADVLTIVLAEEERLSHADGIDDFVVHFDEDGRLLLVEVLRASKVIPLMVESLAKKEVLVT